MDIPDYTPKFFLGEEINPACVKCDDPLSSDTEDHVCDNQSLTVVEPVNPSVCHHSPQCVIRQPYPPPLPLVTHIKSDISKYHIHILDTGGVPARYGGHDHCLKGHSKNYGCEACVWLKWYGELYGLPDINPQDFKKYLIYT